MHHFRGPLRCSYRIDLSNHTRSILSCGYALLKNTKVFEGTLGLFFELALLLSSQEQFLCVRFAAKRIIGAFIYDGVVTSSYFVRWARRQRHWSKITIIRAKSLAPTSFFNETQSRQGINEWELHWPSRIQTSSCPRSCIVWPHRISYGEGVRYLPHR